MSNNFILNVIPSFYPAIKYGGPNINLHKLSLQISKKKRIKVFTTDKSLSNKFSNKTILYNKNYSVTYFKVLNKKNSKFYFSISFVINYLRIVRESYIVHIHTLFQFPCFIVLFLNIFYKKKLFISLRGTFTKDTLNKNIYRLLFKKIVFYLFKYTNPTFLFSSKLELNDFNKIFKLNPLNYKIIPNGTDLNPIYFHKKINKKKIRLVYFGRLDPKKNILKIIKNISNNKSFFLDLYVFINDLNYFKEIKIYIEKYDLNKRVIFKKSFEDIKVFKKFSKNYDFSIFLSDKENFCNSALESIFLGIPVIMNQNIGLSNFLRKNVDYLYVSNIKHLNDKLSALTNKDFLNIKKQMYKNSLKFRMENIVNTYINSYYQL